MFPGNQEAVLTRVPNNMLSLSQMRPMRISKTVVAEEALKAFCIGKENNNFKLTSYSPLSLGGECDISMVCSLRVRSYQSS